MTITTTSGSRPSTSSGLIVVCGGIELPAPGRWVIPAQTLAVSVGTGWARRARRRLVEGALVVGNETTLELGTVAGGPGTGTGFHFRGTLVSGDSIGRWRVEGVVTSADIETRHTMTIDIAYHGVFRSGTHGVAWLVITGGDVRAGSMRRRNRRGVVRGISGGLNAVLHDRPSDGQPTDPSASDRFVMGSAA